MISGMKGAGVKDLTQFLMEQACIFLFLLYISCIQIMVTSRKQQCSFLGVATVPPLIIESQFFFSFTMHMNLFFLQLDFFFYLIFFF